MITDILHQAMQELPGMMEDSSRWQSKLVDYHPPKVERIYTTEHFRTRIAYRVSLHRIYGCPTPALMHVHPWPSAVRIIRGSYIMESGKVNCCEYRRSLITRMVEGSEYEMRSKEDWHSVSPLNEPALTVMVTGIPFSIPHKSMAKQPQPGALRELDAFEFDDLFQEFKCALQK